MTLPLHVVVPVKVTLLYGGISALIVTALGLNVSLRRLTKKVFVTADVPKDMVRPIRAHGNAAEWVPIQILLLALLEMSGVGSVALHVLGGTIVVARLLHVFGFFAKNRASIAGATLTYTVMATMSIWAIALHFAR